VAGSCLLGLGGERIAIAVALHVASQSQVEHVEFAALRRSGGQEFASRSGTIESFLIISGLSRRLNFSGIRADRACARGGRKG